ncbi:hypothetical protein A9404_11100 [Halothiobacillus diazotrophicus]|uniref:Smr domain-containing protein n=1 Tax=Halothiobacillus diazotrophicus TaxID=1860122 RepID=A0A191ZJ36_9GAMM|nr:Smr/MutS family protein [Halothiobacillus diazotrophicus]ANJ67853.1 hypothetical protein A9404_11100 [Halothiobacillus diazotrophicus]
MAQTGKRPPPSDLSPDEIALFREAIGDVDSVGDPTTLPPEPTRPSPRQAARRQDRLQDFLEEPRLSDGFALEEPIEHGETLSYLRPDTQPTVLRKLRRGQFSCAASLDLHGMTVDEARISIATFFQAQRRDVRCCVRIVHGKGNRSQRQIPVLKRMVNHWLPQRDDVIAFCSTPPHDGGTGAIYVLLRKL